MNKLERLLAKVEIPEGCWIWKGATNRAGYGRLRTGPRPGRLETTHRLMWEAVHGPLLPGANVLHTCDNPPCVNPAHLYVGTAAENARDRDVRGRTRTKLTADQVWLIRDAYAAGWGLSRLAAQFSVSPSTVHAIVNRTAWKHLV